MLHNLPLLYAQRIRQFNGDMGYLAEEHLDWFLDWTNLEEVDHDDVKVGIFPQCLAEEARIWLTNLVAR